jgi:hypothetical protein
VIAISGLLVVVAFVTLILGVFQRGLGMIYVSIAASVAAAVTLATGVMRSRPKAVAVGAPEPLGTWGGTATPVLDQPLEEQAPVEEAPLVLVEEEEEPATQVLRLDEAEEEEAAAEEEAPAPKASLPARARKTPAKGAKKAAAKTATAAKSPAKKAAKAAKSTATGSVVVVPGRDKYHKDGCRYTKGQVTQTITRAAAKREGYNACGVCKP